MNKDLYKILIDKSNIGYGYYRIITDKKNIPIDYEFVEVNSAFEKITGLKKEFIIGKTIKYLFPNYREHVNIWIKEYGDIAINNNEIEFERYSPPLKKWFSIKSFSPEKNYFVTIFSDITENKIISFTNDLILNKTSNEINYQEISDFLLKIINAKYIMFNVYDKPNKYFITKSISGANNLIKKVSSILGFDIIDHKWDFNKDPDKELKNNFNYYSSLRETPEKFISDFTIGVLEKIFKFKSIYMHKIIENNNIIGEFFIFMNVGDRLKNKDFLELYSNQIGLLLSKKLNQDKLIKNQEKLKLATEGTGIGIWKYDLEKDFLEWDENMFILYDLDKSSFNNSFDDWKNSILEDSREISSKIFYDSIKSNKKFYIELPIKLKDNSIRYLAGKSYVIRDENGTAKEVIGINYDITDTVNMKKSIINQNNRINGIIRTIPDILFVFDKNGFYKEIFTADDSLLVNPKEFLLNKNLKDILDSEQAELFLDIINKSLVNKKLYQFEYFLIINNKKKFFQARVLSLNKNEIIALVRDITEYKNTQNKLSNAKKDAEKANQSKSLFLAKASHDLRTPLNGILAGTELAINDENIDNIKKYMSWVKTSGHKLLSIIEDILDISKIEKNILVLQNSKFELYDLLNSIILPYKAKSKEKNIDFLFNFNSEDKINLKGDTKKITRILNNLLDNSFKFTEKGRIEFNHFIQKIDKNKVKLSFQIKDTGIGIDKKAIDLLAKPYSQYHEDINKYGGYGLGLNIVYELIELMKGKIFVTSKLNKGTDISFYVILENEVNEDLIIKNKYMYELKSNNNYNILLVEDDEISCEIIKNILDKDNLKLDIAKNGKKALQLFLENKYDLILLDIEMPVLNGIDFIKIIREKEKSKTKIIAVTAHIFKKDIEKYNSLGINEIISKPIDIDLFIKTLETFLK